MRGIDTNMLVRYVTNDDLKQAEVVDRLFHDCDAAGERMFVSVIVLCELNTASNVLAHPAP
jgi:predicted nucleic-acid-binding protein